MGEYIAAIDGGGTKTLGAICDKNGTVKLMPREAGCNPFDNVNWKTGLLQSIDHFKVLDVEISTINFGMPGYGEMAANDLAVQNSVENSGLSGRFLFINDVEMAFYGAFPDSDGVLLLAGTGSMGVARGPNGLVRSGGWGDVYGDEGSAYWIGREALSEASKTLDGRAEDYEFALSVFKYLHLDRVESVSLNPMELLKWVAQQEHKRSAIASLAQGIDAIANGGNRTAMRIITKAAEEIGSLGRALAQRSGLEKPINWAPAGSVFNSKILTLAVSKSLKNDPIKPKLSPLAGGLLLAAKAAGWKCEDKFIANLAKGSQ